MNGNTSLADKLEPSMILFSRRMEEQRARDEEAKDYYANVFKPIKKSLYRPTRQVLQEKMERRLAQRTKNPNVPRTLDFRTAPEWPFDNDPDDDYFEMLLFMHRTRGRLVLPEPWVGK